MKLYKLDKEKVDARLKELGLTQQGFSVAVGKSKSWLSTTLNDSKAAGVSASVVDLIEDRLFVPHGTFIAEEPAQPKATSAPVVSEGTGILIKQLGYKLDAIAEKMTAVVEANALMVKAIGDLREQNKELMEAVLQKEKEICTLNARLLSVWERKGN